MPGTRLSSGRPRGEEPGRPPTSQRQSAGRSSGPPPWRHRWGGGRGLLVGLLVDAPEPVAAADQGQGGREVLRGCAAGSPRWQTVRSRAASCTLTTVSVRRASGGIVESMLVAVVTHWSSTKTGPGRAAAAVAVAVVLGGQAGGDDRSSPVDPGARDRVGVAHRLCGLQPCPRAGLRIGARGGLSRRPVRRAVLARRRRGRGPCRPLAKLEAAKRAAAVQAQRDADALAEAEAASGRRDSRPGKPPVTPGNSSGNSAMTIPGGAAAPRCGARTGRGVGRRCAAPASGSTGPANGSPSPTPRRAPVAPPQPRPGGRRDPQPEPRANLDRPRLVDHAHQNGWVQGYNAQFAVTADQIILEPAGQHQPRRHRQLHPMVDGASPPPPPPCTPATSWARCCSTPATAATTPSPPPAPTG